MDTSSFRSNSISSRQKKPEEKEPKKPVIPEGSARKSKPSRSEKLVEDANAIKDYVKSETPGLFKRFLRELLQGLLNTFLPGGPSRSSGSSIVMTDLNRTGGRNYSRPSSSVYAYEALYFDDYDRADILLNDMREEITTSGYVTVFDMYQMANVPCNNTDMNYGWYNLSSAGILTIPGRGFKLDLPRPVPIRS